MLGKCIKLDGVVAGPLRRDTNRYASNGTLRIAYELQGTMRRRPWLVLIHGMGFDRSGWDPVLPALRRRFRLVLVDNRGTGRSDRPAGSFAVADMVGDVVAVLDAAGIDRAHVLGASLGGMVAQELAITRPERVAQLVLACTTPGWPAGYPMPAASLRLIMATRGIPLEAARLRHTEHALSAQTLERNPALVGRLMQVQGVRPVGREVLSAQAMAGARYAGRLRQGRIQARTLVVHGSADTVVDPRNAKLLADRIAGARLVSFRHTALTALAQLRAAAIRTALTGGIALTPGGDNGRTGPGGGDDRDEDDAGDANLLIRLDDAPVPRYGGQPCPPGIAPSGCRSPRPPG